MKYLIYIYQIDKFVNKLKVKFIYNTNQKKYKCNSIGQLF